MSDEQGGSNGFFRSRANVVLIVFAAIAGFFLFAEHRAHVIEWLPFLLLAACPLLHLFHGHGGHGGHGEHRDRTTDDDRKKP